MNSIQLKQLKLFILSLLLPGLTMGQYVLNGTIQDAENPVEFVNVVLWNSTNMVSGTISDVEGKFTLNAPAGEYRISASFIGYNEWSKMIKLSADLELNNILLETAAQGLDEITVTSKRMLIDHRADRLIFNLSGNIASSGGNAVNALSIAPGLVVANNNVTILGKGASRLMINGRMLELTGEDLIAYLETIAANDILNIEIINNPPAKYDAGSIGGLININLKRGALNSWKNSTTVAYNQNKYSFVDLSNNFFYNKNKLRFSANVSGTKGNKAVQQNLDAFYSKATWELRSQAKEVEDKLSARLGFDYDMSEQMSFGFQYQGNYGTPEILGDTRIDILNLENEIDSSLINAGDNMRIKKSHAINTHFIRKFKKPGRILSVDADYFSFESSGKNDFLVESYSDNEDFLNTNLAGSDRTNQQITNYNMKVDMEHPSSFANLSYGAKLSFINSQSGRRYFNTDSGVPVFDANQSNEFDYQENNQAIYLSASKNINEKLSLQLGLRLENTQTEGFSKTLNDTSKNDYLKLFPTAYLSWQKNENNSFSFNYGRRISRPPFWILNPFRTYINSNSYSEGNPFVQPSFSDNFEFTHLYKRRLRSNVFFNRLSDGFGVIFAAEPETNTQRLTRDNYLEEYSYGLVESYTAEIKPWWQSSNTLLLAHAKSKFDEKVAATPINSLQVYTATRNTFTLSKRSSIQVNLFYQNAYDRSLYHLGDMFGADLGFQQKLWKDKLQLSVFINDIFNTAFLNDYSSVVNNVRQSYEENNSSRFVRISLSYHFGNDKINVRDRRFGNEEERGRTN